MAALVLYLCLIAAGTQVNLFPLRADWPQWRGPQRDGRVADIFWPASLDENHLKPVWRAPLGPSYSGPVVAGQLVFVTESTNQLTEAVLAFDRSTGKLHWRQEWEGYVKVPFFAKANGDWIRATPTYADGRLFVAGMRDVLVCFQAETGEELWRVDFVKDHSKPVPDFGFVSSPLVVDDAVYVQAGAAFVKLDAPTGRVLWRTLEDEGGMWGSAFSSPVAARLAGVDQLIVQTRTTLAGVSPEDGKVLWQQPIKAFRGMNILTPVVFGDTIFTTAYGGKAHQFRIRPEGAGLVAEEVWTARAEGYMSTPVVRDGHAYLHLRNQRITCLDLNTGFSTWTSEEKFGKYWSLILNQDRILALDERGWLILLEADPEKLTILSRRQVAEHESWAHLAASGGELYVRDLHGLAAYRWSVP
ncbi:MAG: PQQ-binding-like beta-propeller repeat protein [Verrucomicrobia bacterium]|nr:PQQ-binding-like beta-propeller repeat protein [Verrucomicrobiota bacterium]